MEQDLPEEVVQEQEEAWGEVVAKAEWGVPEQVLSPGESVYVPLVGLLLLTKQDCRAIK